eukprot:gene4762-6055_t
MDNILDPSISTSKSKSRPISAARSRSNSIGPKSVQTKNNRPSSATATRKLKSHGEIKREKERLRIEQENRLFVKRLSKHTSKLDSYAEGNAGHPVSSNRAEAGGPRRPRADSSETKENRSVRGKSVDGRLDEKSVASSRAGKSKSGSVADRSGPERSQYQPKKSAISAQKMESAAAAGGGNREYWEHSDLIDTVSALKEEIRVLEKQTVDLKSKLSRSKVALSRYEFAHNRLKSKVANPSAGASQVGPGPSRVSNVAESKHDGEERNLEHMADDTGQRSVARATITLEAPSAANKDRRRGEAVGVSKELRPAVESVSGMEGPAGVVSKRKQTKEDNDYEDDYEEEGGGGRRDVVEGKDTESAGSGAEEGVGKYDDPELEDMVVEHEAYQELRRSLLRRIVAAKARCDAARRESEKT